LPPIRLFTLKRPGSPNGRFPADFSEFRSISLSEDMFQMENKLCRLIFTTFRFRMHKISAKHFHSEKEIHGGEPRVFNHEQLYWTNRDVVISHSEIWRDCLLIPNPSLFTEFRVIFFATTISVAFILQHRSFPSGFSLSAMNWCCNYLCCVSFSDRLSSTTFQFQPGLMSKGICFNRD
jgi:hypothetical protein